MDDLDRYLADLRGLRRGMPGAIPTFSDKDGRTTAEVLFLFEDPGKSGAAVSGVVDRDNDDPTAAAFREANAQVLNRKSTVSWNAMPWARQKTVAREIHLVRQWRLVPRQLDALPHVSVVVLCGNVARNLTGDVYDYGADHDRDLLVLHGPYPSRRGLQGTSWFSVNPERSVEEGHVMAREVNHQLLHHLRYLDATVVHVDPVQEAGEEHRITAHSHDGLPTHSH